jgi:alpha-glucuronidase
MLWRRLCVVSSFVLLVGLIGPSPLRSEDGSLGWLRYAPPGTEAVAKWHNLPADLVSLDSSPVVQSAQAEIVTGVRSMLGRTLHPDTKIPNEDALVLGTNAELQAAFPLFHPAEIQPGGFSISSLNTRGHSYWLIAGADPRGVLYGAFHLLLGMARGEVLASLQGVESPSAPIRWVNQWDNLGGTIERGYAGPSIFFDQGNVRADLTRAREYARLLASVGINGCTINNVNSNLRMLTPEMIHQVARIADAFRPWGVRLSMSVVLSSPKSMGGLDTFDPLDPQVISWWHAKADEIYAQIPDFAGFVVKADSEGQPGPSQYGRTPAEAANLLANALRPHGGVLIYRAFVYNHHLNWQDMKADRARAAYDIFHPLDGQFADNVVVQIKHGPIDFQVREPVSPLFAGLRQTNQAIELQITQEYTGQQRHLVFLPTMWKTALDFDLRADNRSTPVKEIVEGKSFHRPLGGFVGVANVGMNTNWLAHPLAMANLYGFGRLAWNPDTSAQAIAGDWTQLTFGNHPKVDSTVARMLLSSWQIYEDYTGSLGIGTLTNIVGPHYGPGVESAERNGWGQWFRADREGVGMDRTVATGTGYIGQYPAEVAAMYESLATCPDALLLFMHHVPYTYQLHSGKTAIQYIYDAHYAGAAAAAGLVRAWTGLDGLIDDERYAKTLALLEYQAGHAIVWRDAVTTWFLKQSGIPDDQSRVGNHPNRIEAETMQLDGYTAIDVTPWETASGGKGVACLNRSECSASTMLDRPAGRYDLTVQYFDLRSGVSSFKLLLNQQLVGEWKADSILPGQAPDGDNSTRHIFQGVQLRSGDRLTVEGTADHNDPAALDYIAITPENESAAETTTRGKAQ